MLNIKLLIGENNGKFPGSNCVLVQDQKTTILIDTGCKTSDIMNLRDKIDAIVYTHIHPDHIANHQLISGKTIIIPYQDSAYNTIEELAKRYAPPVWEHWVSYAKAVFNLETLPKYTEIYYSWEPFKIKNIEITPILAPGHTKGHHLLLIEDHLHIADIDLSKFGPWYGHPESSLIEFINDLKLPIKIDAKTYTTSHRPETFTREQLLHEIENYKKRLCRQIQKLLQSINPDQPVKPANYIEKGIIYNRYLPMMEEIMKYFEQNIIERILETLTYHNYADKIKHGYIVKKTENIEKLCVKILS